MGTFLQNIPKACLISHGASEILERNDPNQLRFSPKNTKREKPIKGNSKFTKCSSIPLKGRILTVTSMVQLTHNAKEERN
jgi:hypothetical protein